MKIGWIGHSLSCCVSHFGPFQQSFWSASSKGDVPLEAKSAGLSFPARCPFPFVARKNCLLLDLRHAIHSATRFVVNVFSCAGDLSSHRKTVSEPVQKNTVVMFSSSVIDNRAPHSKRGIVTVLTGYVNKYYYHYYCSCHVNNIPNFHSNFSVLLFAFFLSSCVLSLNLAKA